MKKININYRKISDGWAIEYFLKNHGFKKTAEALWVQCYYNAEKDVEANTFFEERKPETPETEWKAEVLEAIAEQPTAEQPTEEQTAGNQTTEQAEDTAEQQEERTRPEKWKEIKEARKKSLFWARRLSYKSADSHTEWKEKYEEAKKHVEEVKAKYAETSNCTH